MAASDQLQQFQRATSALAQLVARGIARILVGPGTFGAVWEPPIGVRFEVAFHQQEVTHTLEAHGVSRDELEQTLGDIGEVLTAAVTSASSDVLSRARQSERRSVREDPDVTTQKYRIVEQAFAMNELRARAWLKGTSKNDLPLRLTWEVGRKYFDSISSAPPTSVSFATMKIATGPAQHDVFFALSRRGYHEVTITVDREDIVTFRDQLNSLLERFDEVDRSAADEETR